MSHICSECFADMFDHPERCYGREEAEEESHYHLPPLCCQDCGCGSFDESHPIAVEAAR